MAKTSFIFSTYLDLPTNASDPSSPQTNYIRLYNKNGVLYQLSTSGILTPVIYPILNPAPTSNILTATGGTITTSGNYKIHTFTTSGTFTITSGFGPVQYLIVGGGGGGGGPNVCSGSGGGGGGAVLYGTQIMNTGNYSVVIGAGGAQATNGSNSIVSGIGVAIGGGSGGTNGQAGFDGGSGGGAGAGADGSGDDGEF